jgi:biotin carboxylase
VTNSKPLVLVLGSGYHLYREYLLAGIARAARVWLLTPREPQWECGYVVGSTLLDPFDTRAVLAAGSEIAATREVSGVISWDELLVLNAARLAERLGLPGPGAVAVAACRNKATTRQSLARHGVPQPASLVAGSADEARESARRLGFPVVVKPLSLGASIGVTRVDTPEALEEAYRHASAAFEDDNPPRATVLVEECVVGEEISVDSAIVGSRVTPLFVARKMVGFGSACEEVGHVVQPADPLLSDSAFLRFLQDVHTALGFDTGITHTEVMLTAAGPRLIEVNARLGGDLIPYVAGYATGVDAGSLAVEVALGREPAAPAPATPVTARIDFLYPDTDCVTESVDRHGPLPAGVVEAVPLASPGQDLVLPPAGHVGGRFGYVISTAPDAADCAVVADRGRQSLVLRAAATVPA